MILNADGRLTETGQISRCPAYNAVNKTKSVDGVDESSMYMQ